MQGANVTAGSPFCFRRVEHFFSHRTRLGSRTRHRCSRHSNIAMPPDSFGVAPTGTVVLLKCGHMSAVLNYNSDFRTFSVHGSSVRFWRRLPQSKMYLWSSASFFPYMP